MSRRAARVMQLLLMLPALLVLTPAARAADACSGRYVNPITIENCQSNPASWSAAWQADRAHLTYDPRVLAGYASRPSINAGESIHFYVSSPAVFTIHFYRLGWYGGAGGRLVEVATALTPTPQPGCEWQDGGTTAGYFTCRGWHVSYTLAVPATWTSGIYIAAVRSVVTPAPGVAARTYAHDVVFAVRDDQRRADFVYQQAVATEQAYNNYYYGPGLYSTQTIAGHSVPVAKASFERPFDALDNLQFYRYELPFIVWMEKNGYDVVYSTDVDTHERRQPLFPQYKAFLTSGHSEYWSRQMYDAVQQGRDNGLHLGFFSGNTLYWQMRLEDEHGPAGDETHDSRDRVMVVYRNPYPPNSLGLGDPNPDPAVQTINWRRFPVMRDEEALVGVHFTHPAKCAEHTAPWASIARPPQDGRPQTTPALVERPQPLTVANSASWVYEGTSLRDGDEIPHVYGQEADAFESPEPTAACGRARQDPPAHPPAHRDGSLAVLSQSPFDAGAKNGTQVVLVPTHAPVNSVIYQACSGAWVFGAGDIMWADALGPSFILGADYASSQIQQMTHNVLDVFAGRAPTPALSGGACIPSLAPTLQTALSTLLGVD